MGNTTSTSNIHPLTLRILEYSTFHERGLIFSISRSYYEYSQTDVVYRWLCYRLTQERKVYSLLKLTPGMTWRTTFLELYKIRNLWVGDASQPGEVNGVGQLNENYENILKEHFKINVYARFRPQNDEIQYEHKQITLPLHQRLGLIKISCNLKSNSEALRVLKEEGSWFGKKWEEQHQTQQQRKGKGVVATSSLSKKLTSTPLHAQIQSVDVGSGRVVVMTPDVGIREFSYDGVFPAPCDQKSVYDIAGSRLVADVINGFNATAIMYGQTGSGKTYTMFGLDIFAATLDDGAGGNPHIKPSFIRHSHGLVYRACDSIIQAIASRRPLGIEADLSVTYVEIYGDTVSDLLRNGQRCGHSKTAAHQYVLSGAAEREVFGLDDIVKLLKIGEDQKRRAATAMNDRSTRAHGLFILHLKQRDIHSDVTISSKLFLADLGGSEQVKKSQVEPGKSKRYPLNRGVSATSAAVSAAGVGVAVPENQLSTNLSPDPLASTTSSLTGTEEDQSVTFSTGFELGERMRETVYINLGLLALKKCIEALNNRQPYVPYQDSKLTMLLSAGLAHGKTSVIICNSSDCNHINETITTLRFGEKCSQIEMEVRNNATVLESMLLNIDAEIKDLEEKIIAKERWEVIQEKRSDPLAEEGTVEAGQGGIEKRSVTVLVGAEEERNRLDELIQQRADLTGSEYVQRAFQTKVIGFGKQATKYGQRYNPNEELKAENERFQEKVSMESVPVVIRARGKEWKMGKDLEVTQEVLEKKALTMKRNKLVYSGLS